MTATIHPIGAPIGAKIGAPIGAPIGANGAGDGRGAPIRRLKAAAVSAQTPVQSRALGRGLAQGLAQRSAQQPAQWRVCDRCGKSLPPAVVVVGSDDGEADRAWCSFEHAAEHGWPWLSSEPRKSRKRRKEAEA